MRGRVLVVASAAVVKQQRLVFAASPLVAGLLISRLVVVLPASAHRVVVPGPMVARRVASLQVGDQVPRASLPVASLPEVVQLLVVVHLEELLPVEDEHRRVGERQQLQDELLQREERG